MTYSPLLDYYITGASLLLTWIILDAGHWFLCLQQFLRVDHYSPFGHRLKINKQIVIQIETLGPIDVKQNILHKKWAI